MRRVRAPRRGSAARLNLKNRSAICTARASKVDQAIEQYIEIANSLNEEGSIQKAGVDLQEDPQLKPDHEHTLVQLADILRQQKLYADARGHLKHAPRESGRARDARGAAQARIRLGSPTPRTTRAG